MKILFAVVSVSALALAACNAASTSGSTASTTAVVNTRASAAATTPPTSVSPATAGATSATGASEVASTGRITPEGYGPVRIGMAEADALRALGAGWRADTGAGEPAACHFLSQGSEGPTRVAYMVEEGVVTSVAAANDAPRAGQATVIGDRGVGLGSTEAQVRAAYTSGLVAEPNRYEPRPATDFYVWTSGAPTREGGEPAPTARGLRFSTNAGRVVTNVMAGGPSIMYSEGCA